MLGSSRSHSGFHGAVLEGPFYVGPGCRVAAGARLGPDVTLVGGVRIGRGASVRDSVLWAGVEVGEGARVEGALLGQAVRVGRNAAVPAGAVLGEGTAISDFSRTS